MQPREVYLAGPITGLTYYQASHWRKKAAEDLREAGLRVFDPMEGESILAMLGGAPITPENSEPLVGDPFLRDTRELLLADYILVNLCGEQMSGRPSVGTVFEMGLAWAERLGIVVVHPDPAELHPFIRGAADRVFLNLKEATDWIIEEASR